MTCHPFDHVGPAPDRFVVQARLTDGTPHLRATGFEAGFRESPGAEDSEPLPAAE